MDETVSMKRGLCKNCRDLQRLLRHIGSRHPDLTYSCCRRYSELEWFKDAIRRS